MVNVLWYTIALPSRYDPASIPTPPLKCIDTVKLRCDEVHLHAARPYGLSCSLKINKYKYLHLQIGFLISNLSPREITLKFCKHILNLRAPTPKFMVYEEL